LCITKIWPLPSPQSGQIWRADCIRQRAYFAADAEMYRRAAVFVDKILKGIKPASELSVEQPTTLVINRTTAKALDLTIPDKILAISDELIE
jgi:putative tryptophan/tyrosine transport system substrate-binding protein